MLLRKSVYVLLNIFAVYFYFTGMFKIKKLQEYKTTGCFQKKYNKLVFIIIDGLRIDGAVKTNHNTKYHNNFKFMNSINEKHIKYFLTVADIPTSTSVRVKSILTGLPSNFLNGAESFSHEVIKTDSLISKIIDKSHYFYGDDTWTSFFPELLPNSKTVPAYGKDRVFETEKALMERLVESVNEVEYLMGHFVFLDHYGHIHKTDSKEVQFIMREYDKMIENIYNKMDDESLLVVLSDHGVNDDGSHGGASRDEISATGIFISKNEMHIKENQDLQNIRNAYLKGKYNSGTEWIKSLTSIQMIHQNDILPTVCVLLGLPIPYYSSGNLIYEFIDNISPHLHFLTQKCKVLNKKIRNITSIKAISKESYKASKLICKEYAGKTHYKIILGFALLVTSLIIQMRHLKFATFIRFPNLTIVFTLIMVSHSVWSFIYEDVFWCGALLINKLGIASVVLSFYSIIVGRSPKENEPRCVDFKKSLQAVDASLYLPMLFITIHIINLYSFVRQRKNGFKRLKEYVYKEILTYRNFILAIRYFLPAVLEQNKLAIWISQLTFENLATIVYPPSAVIALNLYKSISNTSNDNVIFILSNMSIFVIQMNHLLSSIDYSIPFTFKSFFDMKIGGFLMIFYYLYFRWTIMYKKVSEKFMLYATLHALLNMIIGVWFYEEFLFYIVFGGRCFIVNFYFLCENIIYLVN